VSVAQLVCSSVRMRAPGALTAWASHIDGELERQYEHLFCVIFALCQASTWPLHSSPISETLVQLGSNVLSAQAMDSSHVCLTIMNLVADGFDHYRCDRQISMGIQIASLLKVLKCAGETFWAGAMRD
jgi:hypothetical protein